MAGGRIARAPAGALVALLVAGCASSYTTRPVPAPSPRPAPPATAPPATPLPDGATAHRVIDLARSVLHAPYLPRGLGRGGFDCSGLTAWVYARIGRLLPRTAREQAAVGLWVALDELRPGDLVFFGRSRQAVSHVGIVVSEPHQPLTMIHAASSRGVVETVVLDSPYWLGRLQLGRRILTG